MITLDHVTKRFAGGGPVVDDVSLTVVPGELCILIGPSGSGKTTTMRMINRLETPTEGRVVVDGREVGTLDEVALRRTIGYVIQQGGLFPHFTVAENVAIVPRLLGWPVARRRERARELLELVGLAPDQFAERYPRQLSGGQQQRVGVARALAADPPIILMDEPFGAVDPITRQGLQRELRRIQAEVRKTIVFVTHDIGEAFLLGDRVILMRDGRVVQDGTPAALLRQPADPFVTAFIGEDRALRTLQYTSLAEIARALPATAGRPDRAVPALRGELSVLDGLRQLATLDGQANDGVGISDKDGGVIAYLSYHDLVATLGETFTDSGEGGDALPH